MISGSLSVEALLPGSPAAIQTVIETVSSGIAPAQAIGNAWQMMTIPGWQGNAATSWAAFVPREAGHHTATPAAMRRASSAMLRYQTAFQTARAEIAAAIMDAARAERATAAAQAEHQSAVRKAGQAEPGTPEAKVPSYTDPGASGLASAEARYAAAVAVFQRTGDEVAAEITAASYTTSGVRPAIMAPPGYKPDIDLSRGWDFIRGFFLQLGDTVMGLLELTWMMTPPGMVQYFIENFGYLFEGPDGWARHDAEMRELWASGAIWKSFANTFLAADKWEDHPYEAAGRVTFEGLSLLIGVLKAPKIVNAARAARVKPQVVDDFLPGLPENAPPLLGRGSTGRVEPRNLSEQLAMTEARTNPLEGKELRLEIGDSRWPSSDGWVKMSMNVNGVEIHYVRNKFTGEIDDFKFK